MRPRLDVAILMLLAAGAATWAAEAVLPPQVDPSLIANYRLVEPALATAGAPSAEGLRQLPTLGVRTVINLMTPAEGADAEKEVVEAQGLRYVSVPISIETFRQQDVDAVAAVLDDPAARPVLIHCSSGNRVGAVWTVWRVQRGLPYGAAEEEGRLIGLRNPALLAAVKRVLGRPGVPSPPDSPGK
jgi:uncharacterized protein (TIGR01244 family)